MHEIRFQGITVILRAIDDDKAVGELIPLHVVRIPLISYSCTPLILIYNLPDCIVNSQICQMEQDLRIGIKCRILAGCLCDS